MSLSMTNCRRTFPEKERAPVLFLRLHKSRRIWSSYRLSRILVTELRDYCNKFNGSSEADAGNPMLEGIRAIHDSLRQLDDDSVILLHIG